MGRTNGRLIPFLKDYLEKESFLNLKWVDKDSQIFSLSLPRYEGRRDLKLYEGILIEWCKINNRKYSGYSGEKAVIQAALRKSVYLVSLPFIDSDNLRYLQFRFATKEEAKEKQRLQKEKQKSKSVYDASDSQSVSKGYVMPLTCEPDLSFPSVPSPNSSVSSGYGSGNEDIEEKMLVPEESGDLANSDLFNSILKNPEMYLGNDAFDDIIGCNDETASMDAIFDQAISSDIKFENRDAVSLTALIGNSEEIKSDDNKLNELMQSSNEIQYLAKPVVDITATMTNFSEPPKTYWLCTRKLYVDATLLLICEKQDIEGEIQVTPGQFVFPNNVFKPGDSYNVEATIELDGKCFLFLSPIY